MDARVNPYGIFGLAEGDAHVIRNSGGVVTDDVIRSLAISQRLLGTRSVILVHHRDCGMAGFCHREFVERLEADIGTRPPWPEAAFPDSAIDVRQSLALLRASSYLSHDGEIRGFVYDEVAGSLSEVTLTGP